MILNFQQYNVSSLKQQTRIAVAEEVLGKRTVERLLAFSSYLLVPKQLNSCPMGKDILIYSKSEVRDYINFSQF
jgi:hypothetical protein